MMPLLLSDGELGSRSTVANGPLRALTDSLATDLERVLARPIFIPRDKALLSREGGRCPRDGVLLDFDPFSPHEHRCPGCGAVYRGELHDRFWIYWYQLWLAERAVHASVLSRVAGLARFERLASDILSGYVECYLSYPNADNVLGPTRLFFSTYLESIWLLQLCIATRLLDRAVPSLASRVRDRIIEPSRAIISEYDEGGSNRQVWNDAALLAAAVLLDDLAAAEQIVYGGSGVAWQLANGLLDDGTWYEGENYHLFAHRGLWYGVTLAEAAGLELPAPLRGRFQQGFSTPFLTALPDFTLPSRRDSQYAISLRQWRIAEHCELGLVRRNDGSLRDALRRLYHDDVPRRSTGRDTSAADVERNMPPTSLDRSDLSWRALLFALPELPPLDAAPIRSVMLGGQGIAVFRRDSARTYVALDYGHSGGGHGHPDRLNLLLAVGDTRWLDDMGTGSYVEHTLHWYRSTLAHNAPLVDGRSQRPVDGVATAYDERGAAGWISAAAEIAPGVSVHRELIVMPDYAIDTVSWSAANEVTFDLPLHVDVELSGVRAVPAELPGGAGLEDGFEFAHDTSVQRIDAGVTIAGRAHSGNDERLALWATSAADCEWWRAVGPGAPGRVEAAFRLMRARGSEGAYVLVWSWDEAVAQVDVGDVIRITLADGSIHEHTATADGRHVELHAGGARSSIDLAGRIDASV
ncbi:MAG TPA: heparinase II/III family protein, partial [Gemmatimonadaceae bacterium]|nr:heparinase II/III family protein [Gemmatimonadaceae bacterium]